MTQMVFKNSVPRKTSSSTGFSFLSAHLQQKKTLPWHPVDVAQELKTSKYADISNIDKAC